MTSNHELSTTPLARSQPENRALPGVHPGLPSTADHIGQAFRRRKGVILLSTLATLLVAVICWAARAPKYQAVCLLQINKSDADRLGLDPNPSNAAAREDPIELNVTMDTHAKALATDALALQVVQQLHLADRPEFRWTPSRFDPPRVRAEAGAPLDKAPHKRTQVLKSFFAHLSVKPVGGTRLIEVRFEDADPVLAAQVANTLASDYVEANFRMRYVATAQVSGWLTKQLEQLKAQANASTQKLAAYQRQAGAMGTRQAANVVLAKLEALNKRLTEAEDNRITRQAIYEVVTSGRTELGSGLAGSSSRAGLNGQNSFEHLQQLRAQQSDLKAQYADASKKYGVEYPKLAQMRSELDALASAIQDEVAASAKRAESDYRAAQRAENALQISFERQKAQASKQNDAAVHLTLLKQEADANRQLYNELELKVKSASVLSGLHSANLVILNSAQPPLDPIHPLKFFLGLGLMAGFLAGCFLVLVQEAADSTIRTPEEAEALTALPQLGMVPDLRCLPFSRFERERIASALRPIVITAPESSAAEAYRQLRTSLFVGSAAPPKLLLVASPLPGDGRTTTALNLAAVLVKSGARVLLVDADLRQPSVSTRLGLLGSAGLSTLLADRTKAATELVIELADLPGLHVLAGQEHITGTAELLGSARMTQLLAEWRRDFDHVILDSSPVLPVTDAVALSNKVDSVLLLARSQVTPRAALVHARDLLLRANARISGVLVNAGDVRWEPYRQYYGYQRALPAAPNVGAVEIVRYIGDR